MATSSSVDSKKKLTPLMTQYWEMKSQHPDKILLFRMGDFFEMFHEDALIAAPLLNIALTKRNKKAEDETPMCGVPHHSISGPIIKLLAAGKKVAICDQIEDPKLAKGIVKRAVTRCLSPGMVYDPESLDQLTANYLCAYDEESISFLEATTGEAFFYRIRTLQQQKELLKVLNPSELVLSTEQMRNDFLETFNSENSSQVYSLHEVNEEEWSSLVGESLSSLPLSAKRVLSYALNMQGTELLSTLKVFVERKLDQRLILTPTVLRHLEVFSTYQGQSRGSLFFAINRTCTSSGARTLKQWLQFPLTDVQVINQRLDQVEDWLKDPSRLQQLRKQLSLLGDVERRLGKITQPSCTPRDLESLKNSISTGIHLQTFVASKLDPMIMNTARELRDCLENTLVDEAPLSSKEGGFIRRGVSPQLDEWIHWDEDSQLMLQQLEQREKESTGISSLKVRFNHVFGYYIEITHTHKAKVPTHYLRKQTLAQAERYTTDELVELEKKILSAQFRRWELERQIFWELRQKVLNAASDLLALAQEWSQWDVLSSLSWLALEFKYQRPQWQGKNKETCSRNLHILGSRHPVVEQEVEKRFVPNDICLEEGGCLLLTGPNMAGKSTLMRQVALTVILAQMGSFVPARSARLPIFDRIFTRIGASDFLAEGLSTFMVEMKETAETLQEATPRSLVILDEVGRGTSTYDGMCLAQSILEYLVENKKSMTFFATHYHELTHLSYKWSQIHNAHMSILEKDGIIQFLHTLVSGPAQKSYGIQVARLAGVPTSVTRRAQMLLNRLEEFQSPSSGQLNFLTYNQLNSDSYG